MCLESKGLAVIDARRLEYGPASKERLVVGRENRRLRVEESASCDGDSEDVHTAARSGRAFTHDSSTSAAGSDSQTIPPPTQRWIEPSTIAKVRMVRARSRSPLA